MPSQFVFWIICSSNGDQEFSCMTQWALIFFSFLLCVGVCTCTYVLHALVCVHVCRGHKPVLGAVHLGLLRQPLIATWNSPVRPVGRQHNGLPSPSPAQALQTQLGENKERVPGLSVSVIFPDCGLKSLISCWLHCLPLSRKSCLQQFLCFSVTCLPLYLANALISGFLLFPNSTILMQMLPHWDSSLRATWISPGLWSLRFEWKWTISYFLWGEKKKRKVVRCSFWF